jgi:hypothetical protein
VTPPPFLTQSKAVVGELDLEGKLFARVPSGVVDPLAPHDQGAERLDVRLALPPAEGGRRGTGLSAAGRDDLQWRLSNHLLPWFASRRLDQITVEDVDSYRTGEGAGGQPRRYVDQ